MDVAILPIGPLQTNSFLLSENGQAVVIDPGGDPSPLISQMQSQNLKLTHILNTHLHCDHIYGNAALAQASGAPILANPEDEYLLQTEVGGGGLMGLPRVQAFAYEPLQPGETQFLDQPCMVLHTPGHTKGSLSFYFPRAERVFVGDLLFNRSIGRTDFPGGSMETLQQSVIEKIFTLPENTVVHSGHGPATTVGEEKLNNPYFTEFTR